MIPTQPDTNVFFTLRTAFANINQTFTEDFYALYWCLQTFVNAGQRCEKSLCFGWGDITLNFQLPSVLYPYITTSSRCQNFHTEFVLVNRNQYNYALLCLDKFLSILKTQQTWFMFSWMQKLLPYYSLYKKLVAAPRKHCHSLHS